MRRSRTSSIIALIVAASIGIVACTDRGPTAAPEPGAEPPPAVLAMLTCTVYVRTESVACSPPGAAVAPGVQAAIIGGQGTYVRLASSGIGYDGTSTFRMNVTVENLAPQALGTADGVTPSPDGVRVFFQSPPTATAGAGPVEVANADGDAFFTASGQKFFRYDGILPPGGTTAAKEWRFTVPNTVVRFSFSVYVAAAVRSETGWLGIWPLAPSLVPGDTVHLSAVARNVAGGTVQGAPAVAWTTSDSAVARVDAQGRVTAAGPGTAVITATGGARTGSVEVYVWDPRATSAPFPTVETFEILGGSPTAGVSDSVIFRAAFREPAHVLNFEVRLRHASGVEGTCRSFSPVPFTAEHVYRCATRFGTGARGGAWRVQWVTVSNRTVTHAALLAAGAPAHVHVRSPDEDNTPPMLDSFRIVTPEVTAGAEPLRMDVRGSDAVSTVSRVDAFISSPGNPRLQLLGRWATTSGRSTLYYVESVIPGYYHGGTFTVDSLRLRDANLNPLVLRRADLAAAGYETQFTVTSENPDTIPPRFTAFSFTPGTVVANGTDSVAVTLAAAEPDDEAGVWFLDLEFQKMADTAQRRRCLVSGATRVHTRTLTCKVGFGPGTEGTWRVRYIRAIDFMNNERVLFTADLQAVPVPTELVVRAP